MTNGRKAGAAGAFAVLAIGGVLAAATLTGDANKTQSADAAAVATTTSYANLDAQVAKFRKASPNVAAAFDAVKVIDQSQDARIAALEAGAVPPVTTAPPVTTTPPPVTTTVPPPVTTTTPTPPSSTLTPAQFESRAVAGATISNATVTGSVEINAANVTVTNVVLQGGLKLNPSADDFSMTGGGGTAFFIYGAKRAKLTNTVWDAQGDAAKSIIWTLSGNPKLPSVTITGGAMRNFYCTHASGGCQDANDHSQAIYLGASERVVIDGMAFDNNGTTAHIFVSSFGGVSHIPDYVCIRNNNFGPTHGAFYSVNVHPDEIPNTANVYIQPGQPSVANLSSKSVFVRNCPS